MSPQAIILLILCSLICLFIILYTVTFVCYHKTTKHGLLVKIYHDKLHYHLPNYKNIRELPETNNIQFISTCRFCNKEIYMGRKKQNKWKTIDVLDDLEK